MNVLLLLLLAFNQRTPVERLRERAAIIATQTQSIDEQALLIAIDWHETQFGLAGIPFGTTSARRARQREIRRAILEGREPPPAFTAADGALSALAILRRARGDCGASWAHMLAHYNHGGNCRVNAYGIRVARTAQRLRRILETYEAHREATEPEESTRSEDIAENESFQSSAR